MNFASRHSQKGSLILLVMCLLAVLGIALAGYLAVSNQSMQFSNRAYATDVSRHLAEMGLERALRSFQASTFNVWTLSGNTAKQTLTISSSPSLPTSYGSSGIVPTVNIRVDNYRATTKAVLWSALTTYAINDYVWYQGVWYICKSAPPTNQDPSNTTYWTAAPAPWSSIANYRPGNIAILGGNAYRCIVANVNMTPPNSTYWTSYAASTWSSATTYSVDDVVFRGGVSYRCVSGSIANSPPNTTYWLSAPVIYSEGVATLPDSAGTTIKTQLRALVEPAALFPNALGATTLVTLSSTGTVDSYNQPLTAAYNAGTTYLPGDVTRSGSTHYRCIATSTGNAPPNASFWTSTLLGYSAVIAGGNTGGTAVSVTSAVMGGYIAAPPSSTTYLPQANFGSGSTVPSLTNSDGSVTSAHATATKIDLTRISRSPYIPQFDIQSVTGAGNLPNGTTILSDNATTLGTAGASTPAIYNITGTTDGGSTRAGLYLDDGADTLTIDGPVILNVTGTLTTNNGRIVISTTGSLEVYFSGTLYVGRNSTTGIQNLTLNPKKCILVGTSAVNTVGTHYYWSTDPFYGTIYMPNAYVSLWNNVVIYGAVSAKNFIAPNSGAIVHYDTSLRTAGAVGTFIDAPYLISEWRELTDPAEKVTMP